MGHEELFNRCLQAIHTKTDGRVLYEGGAPRGGYEFCSQFLDAEGEIQWFILTFPLAIPQVEEPSRDLQPQFRVL